MKSLNAKAHVENKNTLWKNLSKSNLRDRIYIKVWNESLSGKKWISNRREADNCFKIVIDRNSINLN